MALANEAEKNQISVVSVSGSQWPHGHIWLHLSNSLVNIFLSNMED